MIHFTMLDLIKMFRKVTFENLGNCKFAVESFLRATGIQPDKDEDGVAYPFTRESIMEFMAFISLFTNDAVEISGGALYPKHTKPVGDIDLHNLIRGQ